MKEKINEQREVIQKLTQSLKQSVSKQAQGSMSRLSTSAVDAETMTERVSEQGFAHFQAAPGARNQSLRPEVDVQSIKKSIGDVIDTKFTQLSRDL